MKIRIEEFCKGCGHIDGPLVVYRDPFGEATAPGRWPTLTMHSNCFLAYIGDPRPVGLSAPADRDRTTRSRTLGRRDFSKIASPAAFLNVGSWIRALRLS